MLPTREAPRHSHLISQQKFFRPEGAAGIRALGDKNQQPRTPRRAGLLLRMEGDVAFPRKPDVKEAYYH